MSACRSLAGRLFHNLDLQLQNTRLHSCCMFVSRRTSSMWQNTADYDIRRRPTGSRRLDRLEPCRTVTGRPRWPSWNPPDVKPEASSAPVALAWCGRNVDARHQTCSRILDRLQPAHQTLGDAVKQRVAVVQATRNERLDQRLYGLGWHNRGRKDGHWNLSDLQRFLADR